VPLSQEFINLLNLPMPQLRILAANALVSSSRSWKKWDYAEALSVLPREQLEALAGEWLYAGQTSVSWVFLGTRPRDANAMAQPPDSEPSDKANPVEPLGEEIKLDRIRKALKALYPSDPFVADIRPEEVTTTPALVEARVLDDDHVVFTFVVARRVAKVIHNFELADVYADEFFVALLRLKLGVLEIRASHDRAATLTNTWLTELAQHL
jgi:hypothetical protein